MIYRVIGLSVSDNWHVKSDWLKIPRNVSQSSQDAAVLVFLIKLACFMYCTLNVTAIAIYIIGIEKFAIRL